MRVNNVMLYTITRVVAFIILSFSIYLFFAGHHNPGGGFIGGLMTAAALLLLYLSFDLKTIKQIIPFNYTWMIAIGLLLSLGTGVTSMLLGYPFLTQFFDYFDLPFLGETELATAVLFDMGIYLTVVGITLLSILTIGEDR
ncbi:Na+/H+ antiporter MnhB subunit-related protein [Caldalkalibacillus thermarum TA2.A1]|uniref:Na(+)/H(+) antiporter subunit B n=1 Tax=Caldalkalibacillus thermarum (strain TA2.A1) TaxID=986075 RepID=F5L8P5_CALTT|nr:Na(+)/H(+) antiporter subunit B [Caldalkalibacillus thermarum]EGL82284.1 Na+/H+ antiporter MnhB subunit-related protein [Caldalkalibacillus thermarum TA2.A1]QZT33423.1 Na(+)/H(+) antiporter subunit B [Caldalkalibacillus thermarum TA2.A1]